MTTYLPPWTAKISRQTDSTVLSFLLRLLAGEGLAGNVGVPIHERAVGIFLPRPHMQRVERWEAEAIGAFEIMKELPHKLWRPLSRMSLIPVACNHQEVGADQLQMAVCHRFIDDDLRTRGVYYAGGHEGQVHVMESHRSRVGSAHTTE